MTAEPDALRLVPVEPTEAMLAAGQAAGDYGDALKKAYRAMTRAAPVSPVSPDSDLLKEAVGLLREYRDKTPLGHQPHMIAARADAFLSKVEERGRD